MGLKLPNPWGLYDMYGNVWEWCQDWGAANLPGGLVLDPQGPATHWNQRVMRGGSLFDPDKACRSAFYTVLWPEQGYAGNGFRVVLAPGQP